MNLSSFSASVGSGPLIFAAIVSSKAPLFASPSLTVCGPLQVAVRMRVVVPQRQVPLTGDGTFLPERLDRLGVDRRAKGDEQDARQLPVVESVIERLEAIDLLSHSIRNGAGPPPVHHLHVDAGLHQEVLVHRKYALWAFAWHDLDGHSIRRR